MILTLIKITFNRLHRSSARLDETDSRIALRLAIPAAIWRSRHPLGIALSSRRKDWIFQYFY